MTAATSLYLNPQTLAAIGPLELRGTELIIEGLMTGMHKSPFQGFSVEFAQHRTYAAGDDLRRLDWKVFGRTDKLYLKQYQQETNLDLILLVDVSGSMAYSSLPLVPGAPGPWRKFDHAASIAAAMTYLALKQQDRVGLVLFSQQSRTVTRTSNSHGHWRSVVDALSIEKLDPEPPASDAPAEDLAKRITDMNRLFDEVIAKLTHRSLIVLIGDLFDEPEVLEKGLARLHHRRHDLMIFQTLDPAELTFPFRGASEFIGLEGEGRLNLDPAALRKAYVDALGKHQHVLEEMSRRFRFDRLVLNTSEHLGAPLSHFLARRSAMAGKGK